MKPAAPTAAPATPRPNPVKITAARTGALSGSAPAFGIEIGAGAFTEGDGEDRTGNGAGTGDFTPSLGFGSTGARSAGAGATSTRIGSRRIGIIMDAPARSTAIRRSD
jgi:hypothetical protein